MKLLSTVKKMRGSPKNPRHIIWGNSKQEGMSLWRVRSRTSPESDSVCFAFH